jgi:superfamily II DNA or RNA helicase
MEDRDYQATGLSNVRTEYLAGVHQQLIVMATGTGKTVVFSQIRALMHDLLSGKMLVFAHREELVDQAVKTLTKANPTCKVGKEMADFSCDSDCDIVVSCVASIGREGATRLLRFGEFDIVICDEAHHSIASTYMNVFEMTGVLKPDTKKLLVGFTATPKRKNLTRSQKKQITTLDDGELLSLKSVYKKIVFSYPIRKAIKEGWLVPLKGFRLKTDVDLSAVKSVGGDYQQDELSEAVNTPSRNALIVKGWTDYCELRQTVVFTVDIAHAKAVAKQFQDYGYKFEAVWGTDPERASKIARHKAKEITGLCNAQVLTEGYDDWRVSCIIPAAPTKSATKFTQEVGRGTRLQEGTGNLLKAIAAGYALEKADCYILDVVDNSRRCALVTLPSLVGLNPETDLHGESVTKVADEMEALQDKYPSVDLSQLVDLSKVKAYVESLDLFNEPYTAEVTEFSKLKWMSTADDSYVLAIPENKDIQGQFARYLHEKLHIETNELSEYVLSITTVQTDKQLGVYNTLQEAFASADDVVLRCRSSRMPLLTRVAEWHGRAASPPAVKLLTKLGKGNPVLMAKIAKGITAGECSQAISLLQARKG